MSILDNEGHDPNGLGNRPSWDEIRRLNAEIERLRAALKQIANGDPPLEEIECDTVAAWMRGVARSALGEVEQTPPEK